MKKQITTTVAIALITLASTSFAVAGALDFNSVADADILGGGSEYASAELVEGVQFDRLADADFLAGANILALNSTNQSNTAGCNHLADADILDSHSCPTPVVATK